MLFLRPIASKFFLCASFGGVSVRCGPFSRAVILVSAIFVHCIFGRMSISLFVSRIFLLMS
ncbi:hypothetical protein AUJ65_01710 [Candidatus Micrarchaeota archaeon CG1_02_51_15]|nr:MAG: hypothetical protein AUJ65_01710 [Candidatus Micrarchaeota archaeon CG1_02_51_15]